MKTYFVSSGFRYVLVDAISKDQAKMIAMPKLIDLYADRIKSSLSVDFELVINHVRLATQQEKDAIEFHNRMTALHAAN